MADTALHGDPTPDCVTGPALDRGVLAPRRPARSFFGFKRSLATLVVILVGLSLPSVVLGPSSAGASASSGASDPPVASTNVAGVPPSLRAAITRVLGSGGASGDGGFHL